MPSHTEKERAKVRALISQPIDSLSGVPRQRAKIQRKVFNLKANRPGSLIRPPTPTSPRISPKPIIRPTSKPTDITGQAQGIKEIIRKRERLLKNF